MSIPLVSSFRLNGGGYVDGSFEVIYWESPRRLYLSTQVDGYDPLFAQIDFVGPAGLLKTLEGEYYNAFSTETEEVTIGS